MTYPTVVVTWHDAHGAEGWQEPGDTDVRPYVVHSIGFLLPEDAGGKPGHVSLAQSVGGLGADEDHIDGIVHIPRAMTQNVRAIR